MPTTNTDRFKITFNNRLESRLRNSDEARFWHDRRSRYQNTRRQSEPPAPRPKFIVEHSYLGRATRVVKRYAGRLKQTLQHKAGPLGERAIRTIRTPRFWAATSLVVAACVLGYRVHHAMDMKAAQALPPGLQKALDERAVFPTWMYSEPHNILGLEIPSIGEVAPKTVIVKAWRQFNIAFHPDRFSNNGFANEVDAHLAFGIGRSAKEALLEYNVNPYCENNTLPFRTFDAGHNATGLPHFALDCKCSGADVTTFKEAFNFVAATLHTPARTQPITSLADFCPCDSMRIESFRNIASSVDIGTPPPLRRIYDTTSWDIFAPEAFLWKTHRLLNGIRHDWAQSDTDRTRWEQEGWAVAEDWLPEWLRGCPEVSNWVTEYHGRVYRWRSG